MSLLAGSSLEVFVIVFALSLLTLVHLLWLQILGRFTSKSLTVSLVFFMIIIVSVPCNLVIDLNWILDTSSKFSEIIIFNPKSTNFLFFIFRLLQQVRRICPIVQYA